jgi:hypothetical protein
MLRGGVVGDLCEGVSVIFFFLGGVKLSLRFWGVMLTLAFDFGQFLKALHAAWSLASKLVDQHAVVHRSRFPLPPSNKSTYLQKRVAPQLRRTTISTNRFLPPLQAPSEITFISLGRRVRRFISFHSFTIA